MFGKILAGALIGVGAVAAAPFTGGGSLLGAASLAASLSGAGAVGAAVGAGAVGAAVGAAAGDVEKEDHKRSEKRGEQKATAKYKLKLEKLENEMKAMLADVSTREQFIVTAFAVGISCANCDGEVSPEELEELSYFAAGVGKTDMLSKTTKDQISSMVQTPPNLNSVWALINKHGFTTQKHKDIFSEIIHVVIEADGKRESAEVSYVKAWYSLAA
jgi:hypothetical protein